MPSSTLAWSRRSIEGERLRWNKLTMVPLHSSRTGVSTLPTFVAKAWICSLLQSVPITANLCFNSSTFCLASASEMSGIASRMSTTSAIDLPG